MTEIIVNGKCYTLQEGLLFREFLQTLGDFSMPCGGRGRCGKCKVKAVGKLNPIEEKEKKYLTEEEIKQHIRLACCIRILGKCEISWRQEEKISVLFSEEISDTSQNKLFRKFGAVIDIGTTTLAVQLYDAKGLLCMAGTKNPQVSFGADVISRIQKSLEGHDIELSDMICGAVSDLLYQLSEESNINAEEIDTLIITGNTTMLYLFTKRNPKSISKAPFAADHLFGEWIEAKQFSLPCKKAKIYFPPCFSAFVGADVMTALLAVEIWKQKDFCLLVDIGTNGELVLWKNQKIYCCSVAAGPAFEGEGLYMGMQGQKGAISHIERTKQGISVQVIGNTKPVGICGSGAIDAVSWLLESGQIDETGYLEAEKVQISGEVIITQQDIRKIQLAKSAVLAGITTMLFITKNKIQDLQKIYIAGAFGSYLKVKNAIQIGLLPNIPKEKFDVCGNAAILGAAKLLWNKELLNQVKQLTSKAETISLAEEPYFQNCYLEEMFFHK